MPVEKTDRSENVFYDRVDYPAYIRKGCLSAYPNYAAESHWHDDVELILILSGQMQYNINGEVVLLREKEGIFVNGRQLHFGYSQEKSECEFLCVLLHPMLLCASQMVEQKYVQPLLGNEQIPFYHLKGCSEWERTILSAVQEIYDVREDSLAELKIQRAFLEIWIALCAHGMSIQKVHHAENHHLSALKHMMAFIHQHYSEKLRLEAIAAAGGVGKTGCCAIFRKTTNKTPNEYLTEFRLRKAIELLQNTDMSMMEISCEVGFSGASYFAETFRRVYGCTPSAYRKQMHQKTR